MCLSTFFDSSFCIANIERKISCLRKIGLYSPARKWHVYMPVYQLVFVEYLNRESLQVYFEMNFMRKWVRKHYAQNELWSLRTFMFKSFISIYVSPAGTLRFPYVNRMFPLWETYGLRTRNLKNIFAYFYLDWRVFKSLEKGKRKHLA